MAVYLTFGDAAPLLDGHGYCADDARLMAITNKAIQSLMSELIPVGGMMTADITAVGTTITLPLTMDNVIESEVLGTGRVNGSNDIRQGWYDIVNQFVYVDPNLSHDNPLEDLGLIPGVGGVYRTYNYPGLSSGATVRVTGPKCYVPITSSTDFLLIQNILALEKEINAIQKSNYGEPEKAKLYHDEAVDLLTKEVKRHQLDPRNSLKRKAGYDIDMATFQEHSFGYVRARLAHEIPGGLMIGKSELTRVTEVAEQRLMNKGLFVGCLEEFNASVV